MSDDLRLEGLAKRYGARTVVDAIDLTIEAGKFCTLLGPSGCGKTTTLRMVAGLERPEGGAVRLGDRILSSASTGLFVEPEKRGMGMVFQSYAVWPHMTVAGNVEFPLRLRGIGADERRTRVADALAMVGLERFATSSATALSGGQQQRVAIARALVYRPSVLLLDEPLSNLDAKLRETMRGELRGLQRGLGITTVLVTHDQAEAMAVSDRIVVMSEGRIEQAGAPEDVYANPASAFVMDFLGGSNRIEGKVSECGKLIAVGGTSVPFGGGYPPGSPVAMSLRGEDLMLVTPDARREGDWDGRVLAATFLGNRIEYAVDVAGNRLQLEAPAAQRFVEGDRVGVRANIAAARVWPVKAD